MKNEKDGVDKLSSKVDKAIKKLDKEVEDIFYKPLKEAKSNPVLVGSTPAKRLQTQLLKIQNFRRYFLFDKSNFNPQKPTPTNLNPPIVSIGEDEIFAYPKFSWDYTLKAINYGKEWFYSNFMGCSVRVHREKIEIRNLVPLLHIGKGEIVVRGWTYEEIHKTRIPAIRKELEQHCIRVLKAFIDIHGGKTDFQPLTTKKQYEGEINVIGGDFLESIKKQRFYINEVGKKVYNEPKFEHEKFSTAENHMANIALSDFNPEIAGELNRQVNEISEIRATIKELAEADRHLAVNWNAHIPAIHSLNESAKSSAKSSRNLSRQVGRIAKVLEKIQQSSTKTPPKHPKKPIRTRKYGLTDEEIRKIKSLKF